MSVNGLNMTEHAVGRTYESRQLGRRQLGAIGNMATATIVGKESVLTVGSRLGSKYERTIKERILRTAVGGDDPPFFFSPVFCLTQNWG